MAPKRTLRTFRCAYCGEKRSVPSTRGPVPTYCSPAHRQAAYRQRHRRGPVAEGQPRLRDELDMLRMILERASHTKSWGEAREVLAEGLDTDGRSTT